ncbi:hypothetical protein NDU88_001714 [Pleurodeles waltl]|uniref:Uncharacterized protein n=1 Tax=Pleurodeles waltl TaxID=8319 RepID=A0AAV7V8K8_PLEWA|nr:hypothetical protein NDU88_001714 [Pleurodeles waltl]
MWPRQQRRVLQRHGVHDERKKRSAVVPLRNAACKHRNHKSAKKQTAVCSRAAPGTELLMVRRAGAEVATCVQGELDRQHPPLCLRRA